MRLFVLLFLIVFLSFERASSQDSLRLSNDNSKEGIKQNIELLKKYYTSNSEKDPVKAHAYILKALEFATKAKDKELEESLYNFVGRAYEAKGNHSLAIEYYLKSLAILKEKKLYGGQIFCLNDIGNCYFATENFDKALIYYRKAIDIGNEHPEEKAALAVAYNNEGLVFFQHKNYYRALENHRLAFQLRLKVKDPSSWAHSCKTIGVDFTKLGIADSAEHYLKKALHYNSMVDDSLQIAIVWKLESEMFITFNKFAKADSTIHLATNYFRKYHAYKPLITMELSIAEILAEKKQYAKAEPFFLAAIENSKLSKSDNYLGNAYQGLIAMYINSGKRERANEYYHKLISLKDALLAEQMHQAFDLATSQDEIHKLDRQITEAKLKQTKAEAQLESQEIKLKLFLSITIGGAVVALLLNVFLFIQRSQNKKLKMATQNAQNALQAKSEFFSNMSHEIRTPLNGIVGFTELLAAETMTQLQKEYVQSIKFSTDNLMVIINDVLDLSKIESGRLNLEIKDFNLHHLIKEISRNYKIQSKAKGIHYEFFQASDVPIFIRGDQVRIFQILGNLLNNALKFTSDGSINFTISTSQNGQALLFVIKDTGIGIELEKQKHIFEKFTQAEESITRIFGGSGLGLTISKKMANLMDGEISLTSMPGHGSEFTFTLRNFHSEKNIQQPASADDSTLKHSKILTLVKPKLRKVLSVDDNLINQKVITINLKNLGFEVELAANGLEALKKIAEKDYALVLMDFHMPEMNGFEATRQIRKMEDPVKAKIKIIGISADVFDNSKTEAVEAGMNFILNKPINKDDLLNLVAEITKENSSEKIAS
jgi:signal transduction histidine kinase/CheY-like chemotaxis protein